MDSENPSHLAKQFTKERTIHCYQVNDCSSKILVIKGGAYFLRHYQPFSNKIVAISKRRTVFFSVQKILSSFYLKKIFLVLKGGTYFFFSTKILSTF